MGPLLEPEGIRFNAVCPGYAESAIIAPFRAELVAPGPRHHPRGVGGRDRRAPAGERPRRRVLVRAAPPRAGRLRLPRHPRTRSALMDFELTDRARDFQERLRAFMDERVHPAEEVYEQQIAEAGDPHFHPPVMEELKEEARSRGLWNLFHPNPEYGPGLTQRRVRDAGRDHRPQPHRPRDGQLRRAGHRQHGGAHAVRHRGAEGPLAAPAARRRDPLGLRDDRARRRQLRRAQHPAAHRARRRRVRAQRAQVVDVGRHARALRDLHRDGQDGSGRARTTSSSR